MHLSVVGMRVSLKNESFIGNHTFVGCENTLFSFKNLLKTHIQKHTETCFQFSVFRCFRFSPLLASKKHRRASSEIWFLRDSQCVHAFCRTRRALDKRPFRC